jgi:phosphoglycolate phosphatase
VAKLRLYGARFYDLESGDQIATGMADICRLVASMSYLIFDFDGTIANSFEVAEKIFYELTGQEPVTDKHFIAHLRRLPLLKAAKEMHISPAQLPRLLIKGRAIMRHRMNEVKAFAGIAPVLRELHESGNNLFIISSNSEPNVKVFLEEHNLLDCFDKVYGGVGLFNKARVLKKVMRRNRIRSDESFYIGDEVRDINAAKHAGVRIVSVAWGYNDIEALKDEKPFAAAMKPDDLLRIFAVDE